MIRNYRTFLRMSRSVVVLLLIAVVAVSLQLAAQAADSHQNQEKQTVASNTKFYCNVKALNPTERAEHKALTDKIIATRKEIVETPIGYEFQFDPSTISLAELAKWVTAEGKCCPFFDFHIDLERVGSLLCLRLTGEAGIKQFIRTEFQVPAK
jgi:hypothetical protein